MTALAFVDTNIFCYTKDLSSPVKREKALELIISLSKSDSLKISVQVVSEFYVFLLIHSTSDADKLAAKISAQSLLRYSPLPIDASLQFEGWRIEEEYKFSWWDSLMVAAALKLKCGIFYSEDLQDGMKIGALNVCNPFSSAA